MSEEEIEHGLIQPKRSRHMTAYSEEALAKLKAAVRKAALLDAARAVCPNCRDGIPLIKNQTQFHDTHPTSWFCRVSAIHQLIAAEAEAEQGQGKGQQGQEGE